MVIITRGVGGAAEGMWAVLSALSAKWRLHAALQALGGGAPSSLQPAARDLSALCKHPRDSFVRVQLPLTTSPSLRAAMLNARGHLRVGRLLEEMDAFSGVVAQLHCDDGDGARAAPLLVTAAFDRIDLLVGGGGVGGGALSASQDLELAGCVTWAGRSSLNIDLDVVGVGGRPLLRASTTFVARDATGAPVLVPQLATPLTPLEAALRGSGRAATEARKAAAAASLLRAPPSAAELAAVHALFVASQGLPQGPWTEGTRLTSTSVTMPDQKNVYGRVFGGHLMRLGYEIAWAAGWRATGNAPRFLGCSDVLFRAPVEVGTLLHLSAEVAFARGSVFTVVVDFAAETPRSAESPSVVSTNQMTFHFSTEDGSPAPSLFPKSYSAAMRWVAASRHLDHAANAAAAAPRFPREW
jgi:acyl-coenzyme A thioesterase 9